MTLAQVLGDEAVGEPFEGGEVEPLDPLSGDESPEQLLDHDGVGKEPLVAGIVLQRLVSGKADMGFHTHIKRKKRSLSAKYSGSMICGGSPQNLWRSLRSS